MDGSDCFEDHAAFFCDNGGSIEADGEKMVLHFKTQGGEVKYLFLSTRIMQGSDSNETLLDAIRFNVLQVCMSLHQWTVEI